MRKWVWLVLLALIVAGVVSSSGGYNQYASPVNLLQKRVLSTRAQPTEKTFARGSVLLKSIKSSTDITTTSEPTINTPVISTEKLLSHIKQLNFERYTEVGRSRARTYLTQSLKKLGWTPQLQSFEGGVNVIAQRRGTDLKAGAVLVAAHYDTVAGSPGADDNATGVAVLLEVSRLLGSRPTPRTLQLALFDREELGLRGSRAFVGKEQLENLHGVIVMDMLGFACHTVGCQRYPTGLPITPPTDRGDFVAVVGDAEHLPLLNVFQSSQPNLPPVLTVPVPLKGLLMPDTLRSDHAPFWYQGIGAVLLTDTANLRTPHYHKPSDTPATLDKLFLTGAAQIVVNATTKLLESRDRLETQ